MAGNEWINGYLEAILDAGERIDDHRAHDEGSDTCVLASTATKYFVEEVVGHDESALYNTWIKVATNPWEHLQRKLFCSSSMCETNVPEKCTN